MRLRVNIDRGIDLPSGKHEPLGNDFDSSEFEDAEAAELLRMGHVVPLEEANEEPEPKKFGRGGDK